MHCTPATLANGLIAIGDYDVTSVVHSDTYAAIDPTRADLSGKTIFVSGGSKGFGRATALAFAKAGASQIAVGARSDMPQLAQDVEAAAKSAGRSPPKFLPLKLDLEDRKSIDDVAAVVEAEFGRLDILVNNAGTTDFGLLLEADPDKWWQVLTTNLRGPYWLTRALLPLILKGGEKYIVNVASVGALLVTPTLSAYQTSKFALLRLSEFIDAEHSSQGVTSFCIHPGNAPTDLVGGSFEAIPEPYKPGWSTSPC